MHVVCVVDDDFSVRKSLANLLKSAGYQPLCYASGEAFLSSPAVDTALCVVLDLSMPGLSGHQVQQQLHSRGKPIPVICISANDHGAGARCLADGAVCFLVKPFTGDALLNAIDALLAARP